MISQTSRYALRAVAHIAECGPDEPIRVSELAETLGIPRNYLSKILHRITGAGLLVSTRGRGGGFSLGRTPEQIRLLDIIECVDPGETAGGRCLLGKSECNDEDPCAAHGGWCVIRGQVDTFFRETTLAHLAR